MATIGGAAALGLESAIGSLEPGKLADLIVLDTAAIELSPPLGMLSLVVLAGTPELVRHVMVGGKWLVRDRRMVHLDEESIKAEAARSQRSLAAAVGLDPTRLMIAENWSLH
jgi:5-methylthioadenosine/S-adenosylhomocysteine deaminase